MLRLYVNDIIAIHDADQSFIADVLFRADWNDPRLVHSGTAACSVGMQQVWTPVLQLLNRRKIERIREPGLSVATDGQVTLTLRSYGEFSFRADLADFPGESSRAHELHSKSPRRAETHRYRVFDRLIQPALWTATSRTERRSISSIR